MLHHQSHGRVVPHNAAAQMPSPARPQASAGTWSGIPQQAHAQRYASPQTAHHRARTDPTNRPLVANTSHSANAHFSSNRELNFETKTPASPARTLVADQGDSGVLIATIKRLQDSIEEKDHENRLLQEQMKKAKEKAHQDLVKNKTENDRKVSSLVEKLRSQRMLLEMAKDGIEDLNAECLEVNARFSELSHFMHCKDGQPASAYASQQVPDHAGRRSVQDTVLQINRPSAAAGLEGDGSPLHAAHAQIRKLEAELAFSKERSQRIAGLECEIEAYNSTQDEQIRGMQRQITQLQEKLEAEHQRYQQLVNNGVLGLLEGMPTMHSTSKPQSGEKDSVAGMFIGSEGAALGSLSTAESPKVSLSASFFPFRGHGYSPYVNPSDRDGERESKDNSGIPQTRQSVSEIASKFEIGGIVGSSSTVLRAPGRWEREITASPRPAILPLPEYVAVPESKPHVTRGAHNVYDSKGKPPQIPNQPTDARDAYLKSPFQGRLLDYSEEREGNHFTYSSTGVPMGIWSNGPPANENGRQNHVGASPNRIRRATSGLSNDAIGPPSLYQNLNFSGQSHGSPSRPARLPYTEHQASIGRLHGASPVAGLQA